MTIHHRPITPLFLLLFCISMSSKMISTLVSFRHCCVHLWLAKVGIWWRNILYTLLAISLFWWRHSFIKRHQSPSTTLYFAFPWLRPFSWLCASMAVAGRFGSGRACQLPIFQSLLNPRRSIHTIQNVHRPKLLQLSGVVEKCECGACLACARSVTYSTTCNFCHWL